MAYLHRKPSGPKAEFSINADFGHYPISGNVLSVVGLEESEPRAAATARRKSETEVSLAPSGQYPRYRPGMGMDGGDPPSSPLDSAKYAQSVEGQGPQGIPNDWLPGAGFLQQPAPQGSGPTMGMRDPAAAANAAQFNAARQSQAPTPQPSVPPIGGPTMGMTDPAAAANAAQFNSSRPPAPQHNAPPPTSQQPHSASSFASPSVMGGLTGQSQQQRPPRYNTNAGSGMGGQSPWQRQQKQPAMQQKPALQYKTSQSLNSGGGSWGA